MLSLRWEFCFLITDMQQCSCPAWLISLGVLWRGPSWHVVLVCWTVFLLWMMKAWCAGVVLSLHLVQCFLLHKELVRNMPSEWSPVRHSLLSPHHMLYFSLTLWIDHIICDFVAVGQICISTRLLLFQLFIYPRVVRPLLSFRDEYNLVFTWRSHSLSGR